MPSSQIRRFAPRALLLAAFAVLLSAGSAAASTYSITLDGTPLTAKTTAAGEKATISFTGVAGNRVSVRVSSATMSSYTVQVKAPDGTVLRTSGPWGSVGGFVNPVTLPTSGTYKIQLAPATGFGKAVVSAWDVPADPVSTIPTDGTLTTQTYTMPGQNGKLTFSGTAGQRVSLLAGAGSTTAKNVSLSISSPTGPALMTAASVGYTGAFFGPLTLTQTGTYTINTNPQTYMTGTTEFQLWNVPADQTGTLTVGGGAQTLTFATPGQNANLSFAGTAGQKLTLAISPVSLAGVNGATVKIRRPDATLLSTIAVNNAGTLLEPTTLPTTGTYTVSVDPTGQATGSVALSLYASPSDLAGVLTSGTPSTLNLATIGQNAAYTITGTAGQYLALRFANDSVASMKVSVTTPGGATLIAASTFGTTGKFFDGVVLPSTGTYRVAIDPVTISTGSVDLTGYVYANPLTQVATLGTPVTVTTIAGQNAALTFTATAKVSILFTGVTAGTTPINGVNATLTTGATTVTSVSFGNSDKFIEPLTLTAGATYKLTLDPQGGNAGSITTTIYSVPADASFGGTLGSATAVAVATPGQGAKLTFAGTAGHSLSLWLSGNTIGSAISGPTLAKLTSPTGATVETFNLYAHDTMVEPVVLPSTGTYTLSFDPYSSNTGTFSATPYDVPADAAATATVGGGGVTMTTTVPGQNNQLTVTTSSATQVTITYDVSSCCPASISVLKAGVVVRAAGTYNPGDSFTFTPAAGTNTYVIKVDLPSTRVGEVTVWVD